MQVKQAGVWLGMTLFTLSGASVAQTPGQVGDTLRKPPQLRPAPAPQEVRRTVPAPAAPPAGGTRFPVTRFEFYGNTLLDPAELDAQVAGALGRSLSLFEIYEIADRLTKVYVSRGYTLATVNVPAQRIENGVVRLEVIEGRVGRIVFEGLERTRASSLSNYLSGTDPGYVYRGPELAAGLSRLNEVPGLQTRAVLRPGEAYGTSDVLIQAQETPYAVTASVDNHGRKDVGEMRFTASGTLNGPLRNEDQLQVLGLVSEDALLTYGYIAYSIAANYHGTRITLSYGEAQFEVDSVAGLEGENQSGRFKITHPALRGRNDRLNLGLGLSHTSGDADLNGIAISGGTDLTLVEFDAEYLRGWSGGGASQAVLGVSSNFDQADFAELAATGPAKGRDDQRLRLELDVLHAQPLPKRIEALLRVAGAWSPDPLPDTQKFSLGGPGSVRGYPASEVRGDRGTLASLTLRRPFALGPVAMHGSVFADTGQVHLDLPQPTADNRQSLSSVGLGLEGRYRKFTGKLDWAFPRDNHEASDGRDDSRLFGSLTVSF